MTAIGKLTGSTKIRVVAIVLGFALVLGTYAASSLHFGDVGLMAPDESYFTLAARNVSEGQMPYRDFAYTQTPLLPYINGVAMKLTGFGMRQHRYVNSFWGLLGLVMVVLAVRKRTGRFEPAFLAGFALAAAPRWVFLQSMAVWCGLTGMFLNLALAAVLWPGSFRKRMFVFALAGTASIACRLSCAPMVFVLFFPLLLDAPNNKERIILAVACLGSGFLAFAPFLIAAPGNFFYLVWQYHMDSEAVRTVYLRASRAYEVSPTALVLMVLALFTTPVLYGKRRWTELLLLLAAVVGYVSPLIPSSSWGVYVSSAAPVAACGSVIALWKSGLVVGTPLRHGAWLLPILILFPRFALPVEIVEGADAEVKQVAAFINDKAGDGPVLSPAGIVAVEAGRRVLPGTDMGQFAVMRAEDADKARKLGMIAIDELVERIAGREPAAIVLMVAPSPWLEWNFGRAFPAAREHPDADQEKLYNAVHNNYEVVATFVTMRVLTPKKTDGTGSR